MNDDEPEELDLPEGTAFFPLIPAELGVNPLLLACLHATVFLCGSDEAIVNGPASEEVMQYLAGYLNRLEGDQLDSVREDMATLVGFAKQEGWPKQEVLFLQNFLKDYGIDGHDED